MPVEIASTSNEKNRSGVGVLRWVCVLPCAYVAHWLFEGLGHALFSFLRSQAYPEFIFPLLQYFPSGIALTFAGALIAPSRKVTVSIGLGILWLPLTWLTHVFGQSTVGIVNYMHATGGSLGALTGIALAARHVSRSRSKVLSDDLQNESDVS